MIPTHFVRETMSSKVLSLTKNIVPQEEGGHFPLNAHPHTHTEKKNSFSGLINIPESHVPDTLLLQQLARYDNIITYHNR